MNRKDFLASLGLAGSFALFGSKCNSSPDPNAECALIPSETAGPFPLDLSANEAFLRQDVTEGRAGVPLELKLRVIGQGNCQPMPNLRVNIWHCDKDGIYSGYDNRMNPGDAKATFLRGYQITDANGEVTFRTIFPGWYPGRICHIHFQVHVSSMYSAVSQLSFPIAEKEALYAAHRALYPKGADPKTFATDNVFSDGVQYQLADLVDNADGTYRSSLEVTVRGEGTTGVGHLEREAARHFSLGANVPNPVVDQTRIPFNLTRPADVELELFDMSAKLLNKLALGHFSQGNHQVPISIRNFNLSAGNYLFQVRVINPEGNFGLQRVMTVAG